MLDRVWWPALGGIVLLSLALLTLIPFGTLIISAFSESGLPSDFSFTAGNLVSVFTQERIYKLLGNSILFSAGTLVVASLFALPISWFIERTDVGGKSVLRVLVLSSIGMPGILMAIGWMLLASPRIGLLNSLLGPLGVFNIYSLPGMMLVQGLSFVPVLFLMISPAMRNIDNSHEEAALMSGAGVMRTMRKVTFPSLRSSIFPALGFVFIVGILTFDIPAIIGIPANIFVLSSEIFFSTTAFSVPQYGYAATISLMIMVLGLASVIFSSRRRRDNREAATITGKLRAGGLGIGRLRYLGYFWIGVYFMLAVVLPFGALGVTSLLEYLTALNALTLDQLSFNNYERLWADPTSLRTFGNTILVAVATASIVTFYAAIIAWLVVRSPLRWRRSFDLLAFLPLLIPGISVGLALRSTALTFTELALYGTLAIIVLACIIEALPFSVRILNGALVQIHPELEEAAVMSQASQWRVFRRVLVPLITPALAFVWLWIFLRSVREFSTVVMLYTPKTQLASTLIYRAFSEADLTMAASLGMIFLAVVLPLTVVVLIWLDRSRQKVGLV